MPPRRPPRFIAVRPSLTRHWRLGFGAVAVIGAQVASTAAAHAESVSERGTPQPMVPTQPELLWRAGSGLDALPATGPDGAIYVVSRQGTLDVIQPNGELRFSINLNGTPTGAIFVDRRGWAYIGLMTGRVVAIDAQGRRQWVFSVPDGIRGDLRFSEGQGLLFQESGGKVLGLNRGGFPTFRLNPRGHVSAGPIGVLGWCVVATAEGELVWGDRWGKRRRITLGTAVLELQATAAGDIWALTRQNLVAYSVQSRELFRRDAVLAMTTIVSESSSAADATASRPDQIEGSIVTAQGQLFGLSRMGIVLQKTPVAMELDLLHRPNMSLDADGNTCMTVTREQIQCWRSSGELRARYTFPNRTLLGPFLDVKGRQSYAASRDGTVFRLP